jgi:VWFA-related protein
MGISRQVGILLLCCSAIAVAQQTPVQETPPPPDSKEPALQQRTSPSPGSSEGSIQLDVVVTGRQGDPVSGLDLKDFTILDNKKAQNILSFQTLGGPLPTTGPQVEVILLHDLENATFEQAAVTQAQIVKFLQQNGGHLPYPTSLAIFSDQGLRMLPTPSTDGNHLAAQLSATVRTIGPAAARIGEIERFQSSLRTLLAIAASEAKRPSRKLLIWTGPGWPLLVGSNYLSSSQDRKRYFDAIVEISTRLREAHIALYSISSINPEKGGALVMAPAQPYLMPSAEAPQQSRAGPGMNSATDASSYKEFVRGVKSVRQADSGDLALQVLAVQSGGRVLDPSNDLAAQISNCVGDLGTYYRISFTPAHAEHSDEYHDLKVQVARPGLTARTNTGFYIQP